MNCLMVSYVVSVTVQRSIFLINHNIDLANAYASNSNAMPKLIIKICCYTIICLGFQERSNATAIR